MPNHVGIYLGPDPKNPGNSLIFDQSTGKPMGIHSYPTDGWHEVNGPTPYDKMPSDSGVTAQPVKK